MELDGRRIFFRKQCFWPDKMEQIHECVRNSLHITQIGIRNCELTELLAHPDRHLVCIDTVYCEKLELLHSKCKSFIMYQNKNHITETDLLVIDDWNVYGQIKNLLQHHHKVNKYIIINNTTLDGEISESVRLNLDLDEQSIKFGYPKADITRGVRLAITEFLTNQSDWRMAYKCTEGKGFTILARSTASITQAIRDARIAVFFHLGNFNLWSYFAKYIRLIFDTFNYVTLYVSYQKQHETLDKIKALYPNTVFILALRGCDIGAQLLLTKHAIDHNCDYDYVLKLHTKSAPFERATMTFPLCGAVEQIVRCMNIFMNVPRTGIICTDIWKFKISRANYNSPLIDRLCSDLGLQFNPEHYFAAGTMFWFDWKRMRDFMKNVDISAIYQSMQSGYMTNIYPTIMHSWERMFGTIYQDFGYSCEEVNIPNYRITSMLPDCPHDGNLLPYFNECNSFALFGSTNFSNALLPLLSCKNKACSYIYAYDTIYFGHHVEAPDFSKILRDLNIAFTHNTQQYQQINLPLVDMLIINLDQYVMAKENPFYHEYRVKKYIYFTGQNIRNGGNGWNIIRKGERYLLLSRI